MLTSSGFVCDVCGKYILLSPVYPFSISGNMFHAHESCIHVVKEMVAQKDYKILPDGPLKELYEEQAKEAYEHGTK